MANLHVRLRGRLLPCVLRERGRLVGGDDGAVLLHEQLLLRSEVREQEKARETVPRVRQPDEDLAPVRRAEGVLHVPSFPTVLSIRATSSRSAVMKAAVNASTSSEGKVCAGWSATA